LFTDYCCGPKPWSDDFSDYVEDREYCLHRFDEYTELISRAGFEQVSCQDISQRFIEILQSDIVKIATLNPATHDLAGLEQSWRQKLARSVAGDHRWGLFTAVKSS
jgi:phosphoethanolamine N-methyltransferase